MKTKLQSAGHGHVTPRPDGAKARCGGPPMCPVCQRELALKKGLRPFGVWQPMLTAPMDGTRILSFNVTPVYDEDTGKTEDVQAISVVYWFLGGWMEYPANPRFVQGQQHTHWMPLPPYPEGVL